MIKAPKKYLLLLLVFCKLMLVSQTNTFTFHVNGTVPAGFADGLNTAGAKWSQYLKITVPVKVNVFTVNSTFFPFSGITFANGRQNFTNAPQSNVLYVTALANQLAGVETNPGQYDMDIYFNLASSFYFGNAKPGGSELDFISIAMHEIGHGLGFYSAGYVDGSGNGSFGNVPSSAIYPATTSFPWRGQDGVPSIYDKHLVTKSGKNLIGCAAQNSSALGDSIKNGPNYFSGSLYTNAANSNSPVQVAGGMGSFSLGEDLLHLHNSSLNTIMAYSWGAGDTVRIPTPVELAILKEIGWNSERTVGLKRSNRERQSVELFPNPAGDELSIVGARIKSVKILNGLGETIKEVVNSSGNVPFVLSVSDFRPGIYLIEINIEDNNSHTVMRFIKE